jgi:hypothetical protein
MPVQQYAGRELIPVIFAVAEKTGSLTSLGF